jgi:hypothetical protein
VGKTAAASHASVEYSTASSPPISQREIAKDCEKLARLWMKRMIAKQMLFIVTPARSSVNDERRRPSTAIPTTINRTAAAPISAGMPTARKPRQIPITAPTDAPLETPSV